MRATSRFLEALHVEHGGEATAITSWERTRDHVDAAHSLVDERSEQAAEVERLMIAAFERDADWQPRAQNGDRA